MVASKGSHVGSGDANLWVTRGPGLLWLGVDDRPSSWLSLSPAGVFDVCGAKPNLKAKLSCLAFLLLLLPRNVCVCLLRNSSSLSGPLRAFLWFWGGIFLTFWGYFLGIFWYFFRILPKLSNLGLSNDLPLIKQLLAIARQVGGEPKQDELTI